MGNYLLLQVSLYKPNLDMLNDVLNQDLTNTAVAIGDCTIFPLMNVPDGNSFADLKVMGFGGSQVKEWYYLVKNNFDNLSKARVVVVGTNPPHRFQALHSPYTSFLPYVMTWADIYSYTFLEKRIDHEEALRFALAKVFNSYLSSQTMRFVSFDKILPNYRTWYDQRFNMIAEATWKEQAKTGNTPKLNPETDIDEYFRKLAALSEKMNHRLVYLMTPRSTWTDDDKYKTDLKTWLDNCKNFNVHCYSMGRTMPDSAFDRNGDGIHMNDPKDMRQFWGLFEEKFRKQSAR